MLQEKEQLDILEEYSNKYDVTELSSEDIIKLMQYPYLIEEIANVFYVSIEELNKIKKDKGVSNIYLENTVRNIEVILDYIENKNIYFGENVRKRLVKYLAYLLLEGVPRKSKYITKILDMDFSRESIREDIIIKNIDKKNRINELGDILLAAENKTKELKNSELAYFLDQNKQWYNQFKKAKDNGKIFGKEELTDEVMLELSIIENCTDSMIGDIFNLTVNQVRYIRSKMRFSNIFKSKFQLFLEAFMYYFESMGLKGDSISNEKFEETCLKVKDIYFRENISGNKDSDDIILNIDGKETTYHVSFSTLKYQTNENKKTRENNGSYHNHKKENEVKRIHGKVGEQLVFSIEKIRLEKMGLKDKIKDVRLIAQVKEDITFDGIGYDLISFNQFKEQICIEVKTCYGKKDKPFFITKKELEFLKSFKKEYHCKEWLIYYVLIDGVDVTIKQITREELAKLKLTPVLYQVG